MKKNEKKAVPPRVEDRSQREKVCISLRAGIHGQVRSLCEQHDIFMDTAYSTAMSNWIAGMEGRALFRPIYQADHMDLERILLAGDPLAIQAIRAVMAALLPAT